MRIEKERWHSYFERLTQSVTASPAETEVAELPGNLTTDAAWVTLVAARYEPERDEIEWVFELPDKTGESYTITAPQAVSVEESERRVAVLEVIDRDGAAHVLRLAEPVEL